MQSTMQSVSHPTCRTMQSVSHPRLVSSRYAGAARQGHDFGGRVVSRGAHLSEGPTRAGAHSSASVPTFAPRPLDQLLDRRPHSAVGMRGRGSGRPQMPGQSLSRRSGRPSSLGAGRPQTSVNLRHPTSRAPTALLHIHSECSILRHSWLASVSYSSNASLAFMDGGGLSASVMTHQQQVHGAGNPEINPEISPEINPEISPEISPEIIGQSPLESSERIPEDHHQIRQDPHGAGKVKLPALNQCARCAAHATRDGEPGWYHLDVGQASRPNWWVTKMPQPWREGRNGPIHNIPRTRYACDACEVWLCKDCFDLRDGCGELHADCWDHRPHGRGLCARTITVG